MNKKAGENRRRQIHRKLRSIEQKIAYQKRRKARLGALPKIVTKAGNTGVTRLEHLEHIARELRRGVCPKALDQSWRHQTPHL